VLVEAGDRQIFQAKQETLEATPEKLEILSRFRADLRELMAPAAGSTPAVNH
jgi:hypothetical protein